MELGLNAEKLLKSDGCNVAAKCVDISNSESIIAFAAQVVLRRLMALCSNTSPHNWNHGPFSNLTCYFHQVREEFGAIDMLVSSLSFQISVSSSRQSAVECALP